MVTLTVPNDNFKPLQGEVVTQVYDSQTGQLVGGETDPFSLVPWKVNPVGIGISSTNNIRNALDVKVTYTGSFGLYVHASGGSVTLPPFAG